MWSYLRVFIFMSLFMYSFMWTCSIWCLDMCFYIVVLILWYGTCFEVGMILCMDKFLLWYHCYLWNVMYLFLWFIFDIYLLWVVCSVFVFLSILCNSVGWRLPIIYQLLCISKPIIYQLLWRLEAIGWLEETICAYIFVILYSWYV